MTRLIQNIPIVTDVTTTQQVDTNDPQDIVTSDGQLVLVKGDSAISWNDISVAGMHMTGTILYQIWRAEGQTPGVFYPIATTYALTYTDTARLNAFENYYVVPLFGGVASGAPSNIVQIQNGLP